MRDVWSWTRSIDNAYKYFKVLEITKKDKSPYCWQLTFFLFLCAFGVLYNTQQYKHNSYVWYVYDSVEKKRNSSTLRLPFGTNSSERKDVMDRYRMILLRGTVKWISFLTVKSATERKRDGVDGKRKRGIAQHSAGMLVGYLLLRKALWGKFSGCLSNQLPLFVTTCIASRSLLPCALIELEPLVVFVRSNYFSARGHFNS